MKRDGKAGSAPRKSSRVKRVLKRVRGGRGSAKLSAIRDSIPNLKSQLNKAVAQQAATMEILRLVADAPNDADLALHRIAEITAQLFGAAGVSFRIAEGDEFKLSVGVGQGAREISTKLYDDPAKRPMVGGRNLAGTVVRENRQIHLPDLDHLEGEQADWPGVVVARRTGIRTMVGTPLRTKDRCIGALMVYRNVRQPFEPAELQLLQSFAAQAAIAIENARLFESERQRRRELAESLEQQTATAEVLRVISSSPGDLKPVFTAMLENAARICGANFGNIYRWENDALHLVASHNLPPAYAIIRGSAPFRPPADSPTARMIETKSVTQVADMAAEEAYAKRDPTFVEGVEIGGIRTLLSVPMLKEDKLVGAFTLYRQEVRPFTDKQVALVSNFANQAVIAIENARLLAELRESLERQTATAEVLGVISGSKFELQPILQSVVDTAGRLCRADAAEIFRLDHGLYRLATGFGVDQAYFEVVRNNPIAPGAGTLVGRAAMNRQVARIDDALADPLYEKKQDAEVARLRSMIGVPLMREGEPIGVIALARKRVEPFVDREIELVTTFADQAVIAIENVRLFEAEQQRRHELAESLEQQTAMAEVLRVISSSPGELEPVFASMLEKAVAICEAKFGNIYRWDGDALHLVATHNTPPAFAEARRYSALKRPGALTVTGRMLATKAVVHFADAAEQPGYADKSDPAAVAAVELGGVRTILAVPMMKEGELIGSFTVYRQEVRPFTDKQIALLEGFAAQAVIAIENTRLLTELRQRTDDLTESLEQQTATSEVLHVISSSPGDLEPVFAALLEKAVRLCGAKFGNLILREGDAFRTVAMHNAPAAYAEARLHRLVQPGPHTAMAEAARTKRAVQVEDVRTGPAYRARDPMVVSAVERAGTRTMLVVPMLKDDEHVGSINIYRQEVLLFNQKQIDIVSNFAAQAVIAVENARLLNELRQRTDDLGRSVGELRALGEVSQAVNSTLDLETVLDTIVAKAVQLSNTDAGAIYVYA
jgi:GAF domain-containing protein